MKKDFMKVMFLMLCAVFAFTFTACSDDDDPVDDAATQVAGSYSGTLEVFIGAMGTDPVAEDSKTINVVKNTANSIDLVISNFSISIPAFQASVDLGTVTISNCALTGSDGNYSFAGSIRIEDVVVPFLGNSMQTDYCEVTFTNATINGNTMTLPLTVNAVLPNGSSISEQLQGITVDFTGTK